MKRYLFVLLVCLCGLTAQAQVFDEWFCDRTLRLDYVFAGDVQHQQLYVDQLVQMPRWYGRRTHLAELPLAGNGQITVRSHRSQQVIYRHSFSTLFQEWLATDEAKHTQRSFENVFLVPFPLDTVDITVQLFDFHNHVQATMTHTVSPSDVLISRQGERLVSPYVTLQQAADTTCCIHIAYVPEGYTAGQMPQYLDHCRQAMKALFRHEPFKSLRPRFNIIALTTPSVDSGVSIPGKGLWLNTVLGSHFDTFYVPRYLTTLHLKQLHNLLAGTPYEHIIILANTPNYGGGGIYNSYNLSYTGGDKFEPVVVHEFGHSFGGLGDEYPYGEEDPMYFADTEPWEPNLTTLHDFSQKWQNLIDQGRASLVEGGGYQTKGVWRGQADCRMRTNEEPDFCPVCQQALERLIRFYTD
ncbi:M64 family metallopeptidase [uncultured Prevotella sp.]|uniref:M64 family metallopeptidase n=1 Tax=uncultured Prevotella sp. TaxID=159272 RepID=UPI002600C9CB|nr:M64 family metallopeptidase [uncultured Prevotella sp.]